MKIRTISSSITNVINVSEQYSKDFSRRSGILGNTNAGDIVVFELRRYSK